MILLNSTAEKIVELNQSSRLFYFGTGGQLIRMLELFEDFHLEDTIYCITDNNSKIWNTNITVNQKSITISPLDEWLSQIDDCDSIIISSIYYDEIYTQLCKLNINSSCYKFPIYAYEYMYNIEDKMKNSPLEDSMVFMSDADYSDNARVLFEYLVKENYNKKYKLIWAVRDVEKYKHLEEIENVEIFLYDIEKIRTIEEATAYIQNKYTSKYFFSTHKYEWLKGLRKDQVFFYLWHGCGYKMSKYGKNHDNIFDYTCVTGDLYKSIQAKYFKCNENKVIVSGIPKCDLFYTTERQVIYQKLTKTIPRISESNIAVWMPTFRHSDVPSMDENTIECETGLQIIYTISQLEAFNSFLKKLNVILIVKLHQYQRRKDIITTNMSNIYILDSVFFEQIDIQPNQLLSIADTLISDYSSAAIDYLNMDKPMAFCQDDIDAFTERRDFLFDPLNDYLPGRIINTYDDMIHFFEDTFIYNLDLEKDKRDELSKIMMKYKDGNNCKRIIDFLINK